MNELEERLKEIKERCEAATEGPWRQRKNKISIYSVALDNHEDKASGITTVDYDIPDATFIAYSRTDVPMLLEMVELVLCKMKEFELDNDSVPYKDLEKISEKYK